MTAQEYISSGLLEAYVAGALSPEEQVDVEAAIARYHEVAAEVTSIEETMWQVAQQTAVAPPPQMQEQLWSAIQNGNVNAKKSSRVLPLSAGRPARSNSLAMAAAVTLLIGSLILNFVLWNRSTSGNNEVLALQHQMDSLRTHNSLLATNLARYQQEMDLMADTTMKPVLMQTAQKGHAMAATLYWSKSKAEGYLAINKLPPPPQGKQYQLWVIDNGKPVDLGVIGNNVANTQSIMKVPNNIPAGQAFAISLEKEGGSPTPTMEQIFVLGKV